jgi:hypothetical protein
MPSLQSWTARWRRGPAPARRGRGVAGRRHTEAGGHTVRSSTITIERDGKTYRGEFRVEKGMMEVTTAAGGRKRTQLGGTPAKSLAHLLLGELINEGKA